MMALVVKIGDEQHGNDKKRIGQPFQVDGRSNQEGLDAHVVSATPYGASEPVPGFGFAMDTFDPPPMAPIEIEFTLSPSEPLAPRTK